MEMPPEDFEVWPDNWEAVQMFLRVQTQWRTAMNGVVGLDYNALAWVFNMYGVVDPPRLLEDLQVMEAAAIAIFNRSEG